MYELNGHIVDDVTWPWKVKVNRIYLWIRILKTVRDSGSV